VCVCLCARTSFAAFAPARPPQERRLYERGDHTSWRKQYFMPASADAGVAGWRSWIDGHGSELPTLPRGADDLGPRLAVAEMFDRCAGRMAVLEKGQRRKRGR
jgi:hypothetical protein